MRIATWNVNSLRVRLPHVLDWLANNDVDVLAMQETKMPDAQFPHAAFQERGFHCVCNGQPAYNGVALVARGPLDAVRCDIGGFEDAQKRVIAANYQGLRVMSVYVPNGQSVGSDKYLYKLRWLEAARSDWERLLVEHPQLVVTGDFNIAPADEDVYDPLAWQGQVLCSEEERAAFRRLLGAGFSDCFRQFEQPEKSFTWWDYRQAAFRRDLGLRIDHVLASTALAPSCRSVQIDRAPRRLERPSDHAPVIADFAWPE